MQSKASRRACAQRWHRLLAALGAICWTLAPAGELFEVPYPDLASAEPAVRATLESARASLDALPAAGPFLSAVLTAADDRFAAARLDRDPPHQVVER